MSYKLLTEHQLEFLSLKGGCTGSSEFTHVKYHIDANHMLQSFVVGNHWKCHEMLPMITTTYEPQCDFQQCCILTSVDSDELVQPPVKLRNSK